MLKITSDSAARRLVLEGSLSGPWVDTLDQCWRRALTLNEPHQVAVDLSELTFVDRRGKALLLAIHRAGGRLSAKCCMNAVLVAELEREGQDAPRGRAPRSFLWLFAALLPTLALVSACASARAEDESPLGGKPPVAVNVAPVVTGTLVETVEVVGSLAPKYAADVKSEVSGTVAEVYVTEWVPVRAGTPLAQLDTTEADAAVEAIRAGEAQARVAETRARREHDRALQLKQYGLITPQAVDDARSALEAAEATARAARAQVHAAEARRAKLFITSPMNGVIALRGVNVGDRVENMGGGDPMFRIVDPRLLDLTVSVPSARLAAIRVGQPLEFSVDALPGRTFTGEVMFINPIVDEASRAARVVAEVPNDDDALKGGLFVRGRIVVSSREAVLQVPRAALLDWDVAAGTAAVFVVREGRAEQRPVRTGPLVGSSVAIESGLTTADQVVTRGGFALKPGDRVTVIGEGV